MAAATSSGVLSPVSITSVGQFLVKRDPDFEDLRDLGEGPGRGQWGPLRKSAAVGLQPARQLGGVGPQPDDEAEAADPAAVDLAEHDAAARGDDRVGKRRSQLGERLFLPVAENRLPPLGEDRADRTPGTRLDFQIGIEKPPVQSVGQDPPHG